MTHRLSLTLALALPVLGLAATPASALVARTAKFRATLKGTQVESSTVPADPANCDAPTVQTRETLSFQQRAPFRIELTWLGSELFVGRTNSVNISTTGNVTRQKSGFTCGDSDDRDKALDCGTRHFPRWLVNLQAFGHNMNLLEGALERRDLFSNCTPIGQHFPEMLAPEERPIVARVSKAATLNRHRRTIVLTAHRTVTERLDRGGTTRTTLDWTLRLTRR